MILMAKITELQKDSLNGKEVVKDVLFNPIQNDAGDWFISKEEVNQVDNPPFLWVKNLTLSEFIRTEIDPFKI